MTEDFELSHGKTPGDLGLEALWFAIHTAVAVIILAIIVFIGIVIHTDVEANGPKVIGTGLAFFIPLIGGFIVAKVQQNRIAKYVWISGLIFFCLVCVWVIDLPTGNGLCEECVNRPIEKLARTFFEINNGSGLMGGDGLLVGTWIPLSMIGYAIGARFGLND